MSQKIDRLVQSHMQRQEKIVKFIKRNTKCFLIKRKLGFRKGKKKGFNVLLRENAKDKFFY